MDFGREYLRPLIPKLKRVRPGKSSGVAAISPPPSDSNASQPAGESAYFSKEHCGHASAPISVGPSPAQLQDSHEIPWPSLYSINIDNNTDNRSSPGSSPGSGPYHETKASFTYESETILPALSRDSSANFTEDQRQTMDRMEQTHAPEAWETVLRQSEHKRQQRQTAKQMSSKEQDTLPVSGQLPLLLLLWPPSSSSLCHCHAVMLSQLQIENTSLHTANWLHPSTVCFSVFIFWFSNKSSPPFLTIHNQPSPPSNTPTPPSASPLPL